MHPLRELTLDDLPRRTSIKWRELGPDVLPLWVAEVDVRLAEPVARALTRAVEPSAGDLHAVQPAQPHGGRAHG